MGVWPERIGDRLPRLSKSREILPDGDLHEPTYLYCFIRYVAVAFHVQTTAPILSIVDSRKACVYLLANNSKCLKKTRGGTLR